MNAEVITYKSLEWYIIKETKKEKLLFLKDFLTKEYIQEYFTDESMVDKYYNVRFNKDKTCPWWEGSYIREVLNGPFLKYLLNINDLNLMKTTVKLKEEERTTEDYVRLITKEEAEKLPTKVLKTLSEHGYFTMSPYNFIEGRACVFGVYGSRRTGGFYYNSVNNLYSVRPVVSLNPNNLITDIDGNEIDLLEEMRRVIKL